MLLQSRRSKLAPQQSLEEKGTAETSTPTSADPASPIPAAAPTAPSSETPSRASSQTLSHTTAAAPDDMQRAASHGSASPSKLDAVHTQSLTSGGQADGSPVAGASTSLDTQLAAEPSTSGIAIIFEFQVPMLLDRHQAFEPPAMIVRALEITAWDVLQFESQRSKPQKELHIGLKGAELGLGMTAGNPSASSPQRAETSARSPSPPVCSVSPLKEDELHQRGENNVTQPSCMRQWYDCVTRDATR